MNELMNLDFEGTPVRVITADDGTPRWALADVCAACGIGNSRDVAARLDDRQKGLHTVETLGGPQKITVVNEDGLYDVILDSRKPAASQPHAGSANGSPARYCRPSANTAPT